MKRAAIVGAGTLAGIAAVLALNPDAGTAASPSPAVAGSATPSTTSGSTPSASTSASATAKATTAASATDGTYTGDTVDVGHGYGTIELEVTVTGGRIVDITALAVPENDPRSSQISQYTVPALVTQAIAAQSPSIAGVSGASYTSNGFEQSLKSALAAAGLSS